MRNVIEKTMRVTLGLGVAGIIGVASTVKLQAVNCLWSCGDCQIIVYGCDICSGSGCDTYAGNCDRTCWNCGTPEDQCA